jgi:hypothetical protein
MSGSTYKGNFYTKGFWTKKRRKFGWAQTILRLEHFRKSHKEDKICKETYKSYCNNIFWNVGEVVQTKIAEIVLHKVELMEIRTYWSVARVPESRDSKIRPRVPRNSEQRMTPLARASSNLTEITKWNESQHSVVGIPTGYWLGDNGVGFRVPAKLRILTSLSSPERLWGSTEPPM